MVVRWLLWAAVVGVGVDVGEATGLVGIDRCRDSCSAVPEDLWPYCCESHNTCCLEFANSCMHDCLPRIFGGDVSIVEERPGLCCALYNLCCFRETIRVSSIRNKGKETTASFPIVHRFHTGPPPAQKPIIQPGLATRAQGRRPAKIPQQELTPKRPNPFRPHAPKKPSRPEHPQTLTKTSTDAQDINSPSVGKVLVRESLHELGKATTDNDRRETLIEVKKPKIRPKLSSSLISRTEVSRNEPTESLGPRRPAIRPISPGTTEERAGRRPGLNRPKVTKRLRRPTQGAQGSDRANEDQRQGGRQRPTQGGRQRLTQGGRQRLSQQGTRERPQGTRERPQGTRERPQQGTRERSQQGKRQRPNQQTGSGREEQTRKQTSDTRRAGKVVVSQTNVDQTQGRKGNVQARPQDSTADSALVVPENHQIVNQAAAEQELAQAQNPNENIVNEAQVTVDSTVQLPLATPMTDDTQSDMMEKLKQTETEGDVKTELEIMEKDADKMIMEGDQMQDKMIDTTMDMVADQPKQMEEMIDQSNTDTEQTIKPTILSQEQALALVKAEIINNANIEEVIVQPTETRPSGSAANAQTRSSSGRTRTRGNQATSDASQTRTSSRTSHSNSRSGTQAQGRPNRGRGRANTRESSDRSNRGEARTRSNTRGRAQAQQVRSETGDRTQSTRRSSRRQ